MKVVVTAFCMVLVLCAATFASGPYAKGKHDKTDYIKREMEHTKKHLAGLDQYRGKGGALSGELTAATAKLKSALREQLALQQKAIAGISAGKPYDEAVKPLHEQKRSVETARNQCDYAREVAGVKSCMAGQYANTPEVKAVGEHLLGRLKAYYAARQDVSDARSDFEATRKMASQRACGAKKAACHNAKPVKCGNCRRVCKSTDSFCGKCGGKIK